MLNQPKYLKSIEKQRENDDYIDISLKGHKFVWTNLYKNELVFGEFKIKKLNLNYFGYQWEVVRNGKVEDSFFSLSNAKKYCIKEIQPD